MPLSQKVSWWSGSYTIVDPRLMIFADPGPVPSGVHDDAPFSPAHNPCCATLVITMSRSGWAETSETFPHSDGVPARFSVTGVHAADTGAVVDAVVGGGAVTRGEIARVVEVVVLGNATEPPVSSASVF